MMIAVPVVGFILGTILGSFTLALADRSLTKKTFLGRSKCPNCGEGLRWYDLIPILSFIALKGRCRYCGDKIGIEYLLAEVVMGLLIGFLFFQEFQAGLGMNLQSLIFLTELVLKIFFVVVLGIVFITDYTKMLIPDRVILPSFVIGAVANLILVFVKIGYLYSYLAQHSIGKYLLPPYNDYFIRHAAMTVEPFLYAVMMAILIGGFFLGLIIITKGKGMGGGDVKLGAFLGLMLGFPQAVLALFTSFLLGAAFSVFLIIIGKKSFGQTIAFGPFLVIGALIALFWGSQILGWYLKLGT